jgi:hypothetical protein
LLHAAFVIATSPDESLVACAPKAPRGIASPETRIVAKTVSGTSPPDIVS